MSPSVCTTVDEIAERVKAASASNTPLRIRGGGTKDFYGRDTTAEHHELLDMGGLTGIVGYEPSELYITTRAGESLANVESVLAERGQCLPFEPPCFAQCGRSGGTVGGMVAAGLSGPSRATSGCVRDFVLGANMINGMGQQLVFGGQVMKNVAGYDVSRLMAGALGTLGVLTEVTLKVLPSAPAEATLRFDMNEATAITQLNRWAGQPLPLNASVWESGSLWVRLRGARAAVDAATTSMGGEASDFDWSALRHHTHPFFADDESAVWRLSVRDTTSPIGMGDSLIEWGGAQRWLRAPVDAAKEIRAVAKKSGGHAVLFRGKDKSCGVFEPLPAALEKIHRDLKRQFDPAGIFNPGRMFENL